MKGGLPHHSEMNAGREKILLHIAVLFLITLHASISLLNEMESLMLMCSQVIQNKGEK